MNSTFNISDIYSYCPPDQMEILEKDLKATSGDTQEEYDAGDQTPNAKGYLYGELFNPTQL